MNNNNIVTTKAFGGTVKVEASMMGKERVRLLNESEGIMAIVYTRNTPTIQAGHGYIVRNIVAADGQKFSQAAGHAMNDQKPTLEKIPVALYNAAIKKATEAQA